MPRVYRNWIQSKDLVSFEVMVRETDLQIRASSNLKVKTEKLVLKYRNSLESYIRRYPEFQSSLKPVDVNNDAPKIVKAMAETALKAGVGPMASVAGAIAEFVGEELLAFSDEVIIENGGDIYIKSLKKRIVGIYAGSSPLTGKIGLEISPEGTPVGVCTSSGTVGHSLSFGKTDAAVVVAKSTALADAAATAVGNLVQAPEDIEKAVEFAKTVQGVRGIIVIIGDKMGVWGDIKICPLQIS